MTLATNGCDLQPIQNCFIQVGNQKITLNNLPEISDSKSAAYNDEPIIGRSIPLKTYSHSENRVISTKLHFFIIKKEDAKTNLRNLRLLESAVYPQEGGPYKPPQVCQIQCGSLLATSGGETQGPLPVCVVLLSYNVTFPTDVAWDKETYCPYKFDVDCQWQVVYAVDDIPWNTNIINRGR
jgi:hypothetical protein